MIGPNETFSDTAEEKSCSGVFILLKNKVGMRQAHKRHYTVKTLSLKHVSPYDSALSAPAFQ